MSQRAALHDTFVIERRFAFGRELVFAAWASSEAKSQWFAGPGGWTAQHRELDFRAGGREQLIGRFPNGGTSRFDARYHEIVPNERIVYVYDMYRNDVRLSISLATIEFREEAAGSRLTITEQEVFLDDFSDARGREEGTRKLIDQLDQSLRRGSVASRGQ